jgi:hypothetical protein
MPALKKAEPYNTQIKVMSEPKKTRQTVMSEPQKSRLEAKEGSVTWAMKGNYIVNPNGCSQMVGSHSKEMLMKQVQSILYEKFDTLLTLKAVEDLVNEDLVKEGSFNPYGNGQTATSFYGTVASFISGIVTGVQRNAIISPNTVTPISCQNLKAVTNYAAFLVASSYANVGAVEQAVIFVYASKIGPIDISLLPIITTYPDVVVLGRGYLTGTIPATNFQPYWTTGSTMSVPDFQSTAVGAYSLYISTVVFNSVSTTNVWAYSVELTLTPGDNNPYQVFATAASPVEVANTEGTTLAVYTAGADTVSVIAPGGIGVHNNLSSSLYVQTDPTDPLAIHTVGSDTVHVNNTPLDPLNITNSGGIAADVTIVGINELTAPVWISELSPNVPVMETIAELNYEENPHIVKPREGGFNPYGNGQTSKRFTVVDDYVDTTSPPFEKIFLPDFKDLPLGDNLESRKNVRIPEDHDEEEVQEAKTMQEVHDDWCALNPPTHMGILPNQPKPFSLIEEEAYTYMAREEETSFQESEEISNWIKDKIRRAPTWNRFAVLCWLDPQEAERITDDQEEPEEVFVGRRERGRSQAREQGPSVPATQGKENPKEKRKGHEDKQDAPKKSPQEKEDGQIAALDRLAAVLTTPTKYITWVMLKKRSRDWKVAVYSKIGSPDLSKAPNYLIGAAREMKDDNCVFFKYMTLLQIDKKILTEDVMLFIAMGEEFSNDGYSEYLQRINNGAMHALNGNTAGGDDNKKYWDRVTAEDMPAKTVLPILNWSQIANKYAAGHITSRATAGLLSNTMGCKFKSISGTNVLNNAEQELPSHWAMGCQRDGHPLAGGPTVNKAYGTKWVEFGLIVCPPKELVPSAQGTQIKTLYEKGKAITATRRSESGFYTRDLYALAEGVNSAQTSMIATYLRMELTRKCLVWADIATSAYIPTSELNRTLLQDQTIPNTNVTVIYNDITLPNDESCGGPAAPRMPFAGVDPFLLRFHVTLQTVPPGSRATVLAIPYKILAALAGLGAGVGIALCIIAHLPYPLNTWSINLLTNDIAGLNPSLTAFLPFLNLIRIASPSSSGVLHILLPVSQDSPLPASLPSMTQALLYAPLNGPTAIGVVPAFARIQPTWLTDPGPIDYDASVYVASWLIPAGGSIKHADVKVFQDNVAELFQNKGELATARWMASNMAYRRRPNLLVDLAGTNAYPTVGAEENNIMQYGADWFGNSDQGYLNILNIADLTPNYQIPIPDLSYWTAVVADTKLVIASPIMFNYAQTPGIYEMAQDLELTRTLHAAGTAFHHWTRIPGSFWDRMYSLVEPNSYAVFCREFYTTNNGWGISDKAKFLSKWIMDAVGYSLPPPSVHSIYSSMVQSPVGMMEHFSTQAGVPVATFNLTVVGISDLWMKRILGTECIEWAIADPPRTQFHGRAEEGTPETLTALQARPADNPPLASQRWAPFRSTRQEDDVMTDAWLDCTKTERGNLRILMQVYPNLSWKLCSRSAGAPVIGMCTTAPIQPVGWAVPLYDPPVNDLFALGCQCDSIFWIDNGLAAHPVWFSVDDGGVQITSFFTQVIAGNQLADLPVPVVTTKLQPINPIRGYAGKMPSRFAAAEPEVPAIAKVSDVAQGD